MRLFNVNVMTEKPTESKISFNDSKFIFKSDEKDNKYITNSLTGQRLRIDKYIDTNENSDNILDEEYEYSSVSGLYSFNSYKVLDSITTDVVLNDKTINPLLLKSKYKNSYELLYVTFDSNYKMIEYSIESYDRIISSYHKKDFYGCAIYFNRDMHNKNETTAVLKATLYNSDKKCLIDVEINIDPDSTKELNINIINNKTDDVAVNKKGIRFKLKLNPHKIPSALIFINTEIDIDTVKKSIVSKNPQFIEVNKDKFNDSDFVNEIENIIAKNHYKSATLVDAFLPNEIIKKLKLTSVFSYDTEKETLKCVRSS